MADLKVSEELAKKFATEKDRDTPYQRWVRAEGLEIISGHYVANLRTIELNPWLRRDALESISITTRPAPPTIVMCAQSRPAHRSRPNASSSRK